MIKTIIFDMDGVIVDSEKLWHRRFHNFLLHHEIHIDEKELYKLIGSNRKLPIWKEILNDVQIPFPLEEIGEKMNATLPLEDMNFACVLNPNIHKLLDTLQERGIRTAIASSSSIELINKMKRECQLEDYFDLTVSGNQFKESKPNPEIFLYTAKQLGQLLEECIVIEDSPIGIQAGKSAGMLVIAKKDDTFGMDQSQADFLIDDLIEILDIYDQIKTP